MTEVTTIQVSKITLDKLKKRKLEVQAKAGKEMSLDDLIQELLR